ncbi:MAG: ribulokinase [candidate division WS1 bacterium]|nr:ribulokinase [candidate division WS1 bacterium]
MASKYALGLDFGTNSVRALIVDVRTGEEVATYVHDYQRGDQGILTDPGNPHVARQSPHDYLEGLAESVTAALTAAANIEGFRPEDVIGIGVDTTGSTPIPVDAQGTPLAFQPEFEDNLNAQAWLWKDHSGLAEAEKITDLAAEHRPQYLSKIGGTYSSEWFFSKVWHCLNVDPRVFEAASSWVELCDYIPGVLVGDTKPEHLKRGVCAAGHKALYCEEWGGLPDEEFLSLLDPQLGKLRARLYEKAYPSSEQAGLLCQEGADKTGLPAGIPVAVGAFDAHHGAVGAGVTVGTLIKIIGTSSCDITVAQKETGASEVPGVCGIVEGSVLPDCYGIEAGQSAVGDILNWFVTYVCGGDAQLHEELTAKAATLRPGQSGLLALDWNNGNRTVLVDARLTGLLLGQTLHTTRAEIYRALIEATAFGALTIQNRLQEYGVPTERIIACGGIAEKNTMFMQIYADVLGTTIEVSRSSQTCALGAAIFGAVAAGKAAGGYDTVEEAQAAMTGVKGLRYVPDQEAHAVYHRLYLLYKQLHDSFGVQGHQEELYGVMKTLLDLKAEASS